MPIFFAGCGIACAAFAAWLWVGRLVASDIQLGLIVTAVISAFIFLALAYVIQVLNEIRQKLDR